MKKIVLLRHGESTWNEENRFTGWTDVDLTEKGLAEARAAFREQIEAPWFRYWLHGTGDKFPWKASPFQTGSNTWHTYAAWPPKPSIRA